MSNHDFPITLIMPTVHHRAALLDRTLTFLSACACPAPIIVSDHSAPDRLGEIAAVANRYGNLGIRVLQHDPGLHFLRRLVECAGAADTPYVHLHADDDFLVPNAVGPLIQAMEDPDCVAVMGINVHLGKTATVGARGGIEQPDAFSRLIAQLEAYSSVLYALRRRDEFIASLSFAAERCPDVQFWQYLESCVAALRGNIRVIDELHYVRSVHGQKWSATLVREQSRDHFPYLILAPEFQPRFAAFRAALVETCATAGAAVDHDALDKGLIHLINHGLGAMGLPKARFGRDAWMARREAHQKVLQEKLGNPADPAAVVMAQILRVLADGSGSGSGRR
jgi:glycosyltransferase domain-containing protein